MIWCIFLIFLGLASARNIKNVKPEYLEALRSSGQDEEFAKLLGVDVSLVKCDDNEQRSETEILETVVSPHGDMLFLEEDDEERQGLNFNKYRNSRWPNGRIPYRITTSDFSSNDINHINNVINDMNRRLTNLKVVPYNNENDYVQVISGNGCWSYVGRIRGQQALSVNRNGCMRAGTIQHEFMHAAGFTHEHNRADRDNNVEVLWDNIPEDWKSQYQKVKEEDYRNIFNYDYYSVMHYGMIAPGTNKDAFRLLNNNADRNQVGQRRGLTDTDVRKVNALYS